MVDFALERRIKGPVAGVDEAGRGPLAGPVVAAAVILVPRRLPKSLLAAIDDSKALDAADRGAIAAELIAFRGRGVEYAIAGAGTAEIERINILHASLLAMRRAVSRLPLVPHLALIDGNMIPTSLPCPAEAVVGGDARSLSIAAASILAKVTRDRCMARLAVRYPVYGWERNAGYATPQHRSALDQHGPTRHHRAGFAPVAAQLALRLEAAASGQD